MVQLFVHDDERGVTVPLALDQELHLDREFLSNGRDLAVSRAPNAPVLRSLGGRWWVMNPGGAALAVFVADEGRRFAVAERCGFPLDDGSVTIHAWSAGYTVRVTVRGSPGWSPVLAGNGRSTQPGLPRATANVLDLFRAKPRHKAILAAHLRPYFQPGVDAPAPLDRPATARCMGLPSHTALEKALNDVSEAIWGMASGHRHEVPGYLIRHRLLLARDQGLVPHKACSHQHGLPA